MTGIWLSADEQRAWRAYVRMSSLLPAQLNRQLQLRPEVPSPLRLPGWLLLHVLLLPSGGTATVAVCRRDLARRR